MILCIIKIVFYTIFISVGDELSLENLRLADIEIITTLGVGGFGRVELVNIFILFKRMFDLIDMLGERYTKFEEIWS